MHQSTPPLPGFNAIRIDYIDLRPRAQPSVVLAKLLRRVNVPLHLMIFCIGSFLNVFVPRIWTTPRVRGPRISIDDPRDAFVTHFLSTYLKYITLLVIWPLKRSRYTQRMTYIKRYERYNIKKLYLQKCYANGNISIRLKNNFFFNESIRVYRYFSTLMLKGNYFTHRYVKYRFVHQTGLSPDTLYTFQERLRVVGDTSESTF